MEITINVPVWMACDIAMAMRIEVVNAEVIERALARMYAELFDPLTGQQTKV